MMEKVVVRIYYNERTYMKDARKMEAKGYVIQSIEGRQRGVLMPAKLTITYVLADKY